MRPTTGLKDMFFDLDPGSQEAGRVRRGRHDPDDQHGARREPRRDPRGARRGHPGVPADAPGRRRSRGSRAAGRISASCSGTSGPINDDLGDAEPGGREAARRARAHRPLLQPPDDPGRQGRVRADPARDPLRKRSLGAIAEQDPSVQRFDLAASGDARAGGDDAQQHGSSSPRSWARPSTSCARSRATSPS